MSHPKLKGYSMIYSCTYDPIRRWQFFLVFLFLGTFSTVSGQYYGMRFSGHEFPLNQRSGLDLTPEESLPIKDDIDLEFFIRLDPDHHSYYGYVFRMLVGDKNIDLIHGVVRENPNNFELIIGDRTSKIVFPLDIDRLCREWIPLRFKVDFKNKTITCFVDGKELSDEFVGFDDKKGLRLLFGAHSFYNFSSTDVPPMIIRDVSLKVKSQQAYHWKLDETKGTTVHSMPAGYSGKAVNPDWLLKHHNTWEKVFDLEISDTVKSCFDIKNEHWYIVSPDSVYIYDLKSDSLQRIAQNTPSFLSKSNNVIFDTLTERLLLYSVDNNYVRIFEPESATWSEADPGEEPLTYYWHHNHFFSPEGKLTILGGYGYHLYNNELQEWNPSDKQFEKIPYTGVLHPRYLAGTGFNPLDSAVYIIGGYGSESGKQSESPDYYYEVLKYTPKDSTFSQVFKFPESDAGFCFANSLVFDNENNLYGLYFSKYEFDNQLQLVKISLTKPDIIELGDPIEYKFIDVHSFADLHYSKSRNALVALSSFSINGISSLSVYTIAFPPQIFDNKEIVEAKGNGTNLFYLLILGLILGSAYLLYLYLPRRSKLPEENRAVAVSISSIEKQKENAIYLFGGFQVFDNQGRDITGQFTPLLKKLFLFIMLHSLRNGKGVSSKALYETFWFDKPVPKARNNRAVNLAKLRNLLEHLDTASITKDAGYWKFELDSSVLYLDYLEYTKIVQRNAALLREDIVSLLSIVENKPFLNNLDAEWLDSFKSHVSNEVIDTFINYIRTSKDDPEFHLHLTNCIFLFDSVSEEALKHKCRLLIKQGKHSLANSVYTRFVNEYKHLYGEEFNRSFNEVIVH